jgi:hypothetical protein
MSAYYDPSTGKWFEYTAATIYDFGAETVPATMTAIADPTDGATTGVIDQSNTNPQALAAQVIKAEYNEWEKTYKPVEQKMINEISFNNPAILGQQVGQAQQAATSASETMSGVTSRQNLERGLSLQPYQAAATSRMQNINRAVNVAGAENLARENIKSQDEQILFGSTANPNVLHNNTIT